MFIVEDIVISFNFFVVFEVIFMGCFIDEEVEVRGGLIVRTRIGSVGLELVLLIFGLSV